MIAESRTTGEDGSAVRTRRADTDDDRARLRHEATMLGLARHPGVVQVVHAHPVGDELTTVAPTRATLADLQGRPDDALRALAAACETVADLHALGLVHGAVTAEAILVGPGRPPVLDRFGSAGLAGEPTPDGTVRRPADDVAQLARLVASAWADRAPARPRRGRRSGPPTGELQDLLTGQAARHPYPARRLARAIAAELGPAVDPSTDLIDPIDPTSVNDALPCGSAAALPHDPADPFARLRPVEVIEARHRPPRVVALGAAVVGVAALAWGVLGVSAGTGGRPQVLPTPTGAPVSTSSPHPSAAAPSTAVPTRPARVLVARDGVLAVGPRRYVVGARDDEVVAATWDCRSTMQVVLLRPATGELFAFAAWARAGHDVSGRATGQVPAGSRLSVATDATGCLEVRATAPDGTARLLRIAPA